MPSMDPENWLSKSEFLVVSYSFSGAKLELRLFKSRHSKIEERSLGVKAPIESKIERPCRGTAII